MIIRTFILFILSALFPIQAFSQPGMALKLKNPIFRMVSYFNGKMIKGGTGVMVSYEKIDFFVTNRHLIMDDSLKNYADSLGIFINHTLSNDDIISGPELAIVYMRIGRDLWYYSPDPKVDLALIVVALDNTNLPMKTVVQVMPANQILSFEELNNMIDSTCILTVVGYPTKETYYNVTSPEFLWGYFKGFSREAIMTDAPAQHGNSGSAIFANRWMGPYYFVGIVSSEAKGLIYGIPSSKIAEYLVEAKKSYR